MHAKLDKVFHFRTEKCVTKNRSSIITVCNILFVTSLYLRNYTLKVMYIPCINSGTEKLCLRFFRTFHPIYVLASPKGNFLNQKSRRLRDRPKIVPIYLFP